MKAYIFTNDKLNFPVLERALAENLFSPIFLCEPSKERAKEMVEVTSDSMIMIDFDLANAAELASYLPSLPTQLAFGSHEARTKAAQSRIKRFVAKPFTRAQLAMAIAETLRAEASLPEPGPVCLSGPLIPLGEIRARWTQQFEAIGKRWTELDRMLNATAEQLKVLLIGKVVIDGDGNPKVPAKDFPLQSALVIEQDESFQRLISRYLAEKCVMQTDSARSGASAWQMMQQGSYDVIILRWEIQEPSGLALYNRLRSAPETRYQPVVVISSMVKPQDFRLLEEDFAVALVTQPVQPKAFAQALAKVVMSAVLAKEHLDALTDLARSSIEAKYFANSKALSVNEKNREIVFSSLKVGGDHFLAHERFDAAESAYATAWKLGDRRLGLLTNYGRACYLGGRSKEALKLMAMADVLAPKNVERLCMLGEVNLAQQSLTDARSHFRQALDIDPDVKKAQGGLEVLQAMEASGQPQPALNDEAASPISSFAAYLNLVGINMARSGNLTDALNYYRSAMTFVHFKANLVKLWFNVGLCYMRGGEMDLAKDAFQKCYTTSDGTHERAAKYLRDANALPDHPAAKPAEYAPAAALIKAVPISAPEPIAVKEPEDFEFERF
jgi:CheY-like chemotaxis protein/Tfp pilus assembly protein PilF